MTAPTRPTRVAASAILVVALPLPPPAYGDDNDEDKTLALALALALAPNKEGTLPLGTRSTPSVGGFSAEENGVVSESANFNSRTNAPSRGCWSGGGVGIGVWLQVKLASHPESKPAFFNSSLSADFLIATATEVVCDDYWSSSVGAEGCLRVGLGCIDRDSVSRSSEVVVNFIAVPLPVPVVVDSGDGGVGEFSARSVRAVECLGCGCPVGSVCAIGQVGRGKGARVKSDVVSNIGRRGNNHSPDNRTG